MFKRLRQKIREFTGESKPNPHIGGEYLNLDSHFSEDKIQSITTEQDHADHLKLDLLIGKDLRFSDSIRAHAVTCGVHYVTVLLKSIKRELGEGNA